MPLTRRSKVKEAWRHPVGHELLQNLLRRTGRTERWLESPLVANRTLQHLDRVAGPGFCDALLEMAAYELDHPTHPEAEQSAWWKEAVVYQIFPPSFMDSDHDGMGDLAGITQRLPYLAGLGVDTLWLWPVLDEGNHGVRDYRALRADLGNMDDFTALAQAAHARQMRVVVGIDVAATSDRHPWFGKPGYHVLKPGSPDAAPNGWLRGGASVWSWYPELESWGLHLFGRHKMDLNWENPSMRAELSDTLKFWTENGADGFVLGPVALLSKAGLEDGGAAFGALNALGYEKLAYGPRLHRYLHELHAALPAGTLLMGELSGVGAEMAKLFTGGTRAELDMMLDADHLTPRARPKQREEDERLDLVELSRYYLKWMERYGADHWMTLFLEGPFGPRIVSRLGASPLYRTILAKLLATMLFTLRGTPILYQGQELGLANTRFASAADLRDAASLRQYADCCERMGEREALQKVLATAADHARTPMPWNSGPHGGFTGAQPWMRLPDGVEYLNAAHQMEDGGSVWQHHQKLIALRRKHPALIYGSFNPVFVKNRKVFCYFRILEGEKWYVEMNLTEREVSRPGRILRSQKLALSNYDAPARSLRPYEANLYRCD